MPIAEIESMTELTRDLETKNKWLSDWLTDWMLGAEYHKAHAVNKKGRKKLGHAAFKILKTDINVSGRSSDVTLSASPDSERQWQNLVKPECADVA